MLSGAVISKACSHFEVLTSSTDERLSGVSSASEEGSQLEDLHDEALLVVMHYKEWTRVSGQL